MFCELRRPREDFGWKNTWRQLQSGSKQRKKERKSLLLKYILCVGHWRFPAGSEKRKVRPPSLRIKINARQNQQSFLPTVHVHITYTYVYIAVYLSDSWGVLLFSYMQQTGSSPGPLCCLQKESRANDDSEKRAGWFVLWTRGNRRTPK